MITIIFCMIGMFICGGVLGALFVMYKVGKELVRAEKEGEIIFVDKIR